MRRPAMVVLAVVAAVVACSKEPEQPPDDFSTATHPAQPAPAKFALDDFQLLRYLEGTWRGVMANGNAFYESYHFVDDSTIVQGKHTDSTFRTKQDSSFIMFRAGAIVDSGAATVYRAETLDSAMVDFRASPTYHFTWTKEGNDAWTARLFSNTPDGDRVTVYPMKRVRRQD